jgi:predicted Ser/Thr protein kinase
METIRPIDVYHPGVQIDIRPFEDREKDAGCLGDIVYELGCYRYPDNGPVEYWYPCTYRKCMVYLWLERPNQTQDTIMFAMRYALHFKVEGVIVREYGKTRLVTEYEPCKPKPLDGKFNAIYQTVEFSELKFVSAITRNIDIVDYNGVKYVHKYMLPGSHQRSFETEFRHYLQIQQCEHVPSLIAIVRTYGAIRGLLMTYIEGQNLGDLSLTSPSDLLPITSKIINVAVELERLGYYDEDLKCHNIIRRKSDGEIFFIDFGGGSTQGFYPEESTWKIFSGIVEANDAIYILGRALLQLWTCPGGNTPEAGIPEGVPEPVRSIVYDCTVARKFESMEELQKTWCPVIERVISEGI